MRATSRRCAGDDRLSDGAASEDTIAAGKRLVRVGSGAGLSLSERLANRLNRLSWRTPIHALRLRGRYPLKLLSVPDDEILGDVARGTALLGGQFSFRGERLAVEGAEYRHLPVGAAFADYIQSFAWLRDLATAAPRAEAAPVAEAITRDWLRACGQYVSDSAWRADLCGRRLLFWTAHAPLILSSSDLVYRSSVLNTIARTARHLERTADRVPPGVPRIAAWCGIVAAGLLIPGGEARQRTGEAGLVRALAGGMSEDGGLVSRAPDEQLDLVGLLAMLSKAYSVRETAIPEAVDAALNRAVAALLGIVLGDGALSAWQGAGPVKAQDVEAVVAASGVRARAASGARLGLSAHERWGHDCGDGCRTAPGEPRHTQRVRLHPRV